jgi:hypothetical protein
MLRSLGLRSPYLQGNSQGTLPCPRVERSGFPVRYTSHTTYIIHITNTTHTTHTTYTTHITHTTHTAYTTHTIYTTHTTHTTHITHTTLTITHTTYTTHTTHTTYIFINIFINIFILAPLTCLCTPHSGPNPFLQTQSPKAAALGSGLLTQELWQGLRPQQRLTLSQVKFQSYTN